MGVFCLSLIHSFGTFYGAQKILALEEPTLPTHIVCRGHGTDGMHTMQLEIVMGCHGVTETG